jgi:subtilisin family serine protease
VAANANNATGITGAAPGVDILPVKVLCADGAGVSSDVAEGINWAVDNGADVVNLSLGGSYTQSIDLAVRYARSHGVVVVAAAGNGEPNPSYPAALTQAIAVGATDSGDAIAKFSNQGAYVDLAAPGVGILSTWANGGYAAKNGTSMASPHVAAAVALVLAARPQWDTDPVAACTQLIRTALDLGAPGRDDAFGYGRIRPDLAVGQPDNDPNQPTCT